VIGVLHVGTFGPRIFDDTDVELLQLVADRAAIAIEHARLFESERSAHRRLEQVQAVTDVALAHLDLDALLSELLGRIRDALGADTCAILLLDEEANELVARAAVGIEEEVEQGVRIPLGKGFAGRIASTRKPVVLDDVDLADIFNPILREKGIKSLLGAPLISRETVVGVVHVGTLTRRLFTPGDVDLLQLVADRVGLAIDKARLHEEMVNLDQMKLNFVAVASHELRTPASAVYGAAMTLQGRGDALPPDTRALLEQTLYEQADRLRRLTEQLLDLSRLDAKAIPVAPQKLAIETVLKDVVDGVGAKASVTIELPQPIEAFVDELVVERVVTNLLVNALDHGRPPIVVRAEQTRRSLRITVSDAGSGVDEDLVPRLFERFERGLDGTGSGLGLAIAKAYALAHGGDLVYDSEGPGARFILTVPVRER
jgi:signal transduction histidine kinase